MLRLSLFVVATQASIGAKKVGEFLQVEPAIEPKAAEPKVEENTRDLLICNAYPGVSAKVERQGKPLLEKLAANECHKIEQTKLVSGDQIGFILDNKAEGSFQVSKLPEKNAMMLLVLERKDHKSDKIAFQSYSFGVGTHDAAQVAVIDTIKGAPTKLAIEDKVELKADGKPASNQRVRLEELDLNRVYSIDAGEYDADFSDDTKRRAKHLLKFENGKDYVLIRAGENSEHVNMMVFPPTSTALHSGAATVALSALVAMLF